MHSFTGNSPATRAPGDIERRTLAFESLCRNRGIRVTSQRLEVYRAVATDIGHPGADRIFERVHAALPAVSLATVYRTLDFLAAEGLIRRVSTTGSVGRYDANLEPHLHLVCRVCGGIMDIEGRPAIGTDFVPVLPENFRVESFDIRVVGVCGPCRAKPAGDRSARNR